MPALVYRYGLLPPVESSEKVSEQMFLAHKYQNRLIEIERKRREAIRAILSQHSSVEALVGSVEQHQARLDELRELIKTRKQGAHLSGIPVEKSVASETKNEIDSLKKTLKVLRAELKEGKRKLKDDPVIQGLIESENEKAHTEALAARKNCGVYWGTYLQIEAAVDAAKRGKMDPHFQRWTGDGAIAVQIQHGMATNDLFSCQDQRAQLNIMRFQKVPGRSGRSRPRLKLRIGSDDQREPIWAEWPLIYHRKFPDATIIKWVKVVRRRTAGVDDWSAHFTIETAAVPGPMVKRGSVVVVDLGWRKEGENDTLRAGGWVDNEDNGGDIMVNPRIRGALRKVEDLRSIRDKNLNAQREVMITWRDAFSETLCLSPEHKERLSWLSQWKSPARFAALALWWRENRLRPFDEAFYDQLEAWRKRDKHLWQWEANGRRKALLRRREDYRVLASKMARQYESLVIERLNLSDMARLPAPESSNRSHPQARSQRFETAPSELRQALIQAFKKNCRRIFTVKASGPAVLLYLAWKDGKEVEEIAAPVETVGSRFKKAATAT